MHLVVKTQLQWDLLGPTTPMLRRPLLPTQEPQVVEITSIGMQKLKESHSITFQAFPLLHMVVSELPLLTAM